MSKMWESCPTLEGRRSGSGLSRRSKASRLACRHFGLCSRTRAADSLSGELETLRALVKGVPGGLVDGHVVSADGSNNHPGLRVELRSRSGQRVVQTVTTNGAGYFRFDWVSPGAYTLVVDRSSSFLNEQRPVEVRRRT